MRSLRRRQVPMTRTPGHHLNVVEGGEGAVVLFLHGASGSWANWTYQMRDLAGSYRVVAPNLRGHGSPWPGPSDVDDFHRDVEDLVEALDLPDRFAVVAHSFGGCLAARYADAHPDRVRALALLNTAGHLPRGWMIRAMEMVSGHAGLVSRHFPWMISTDGTVTTGMLHHTLRQWDCWDALHGLPMPSLVVLGGLDPLIPLDHGRRVVQVLGGSPRLEVIPVGGHVSMIERPDAVTRWLRDLLERAD